MYKFIWINWCGIIMLMIMINLVSFINDHTECQNGGGIRVEKHFADAGSAEKTSVGPKPDDVILYDELVPAADKAAKDNEFQIEKNRWNLTLDVSEKDMVARIVMLEAGGESDLGQQAVTEVIFNRIYSPLFPDTVYEVLSQKNKEVSQFSSWENRNLEKAIPTRQVLENVEAVLDGKSDILPYETLYFSQKGENKNIQITIGNHVFCNQ